MMAGSGYTLTDHTPQAMEALRAGAALAIRDAVKQLRAEYVARAAVDTGFMRESAYTVTSDASTYFQATGQAQGIDEFRKLLDEVEHPTGADAELEGIVAVAATYAAYVEYGTSRMAAQPALTPALAAVQQELATLIEKRLAEVFKVVNISSGAE